VGENDDNDQNMALRRFDASGMGVENDVNPEQKRIRAVRKLSLQFFRSKLVEHFDILFKQNQIKWPSRNGLTTPGVVTAPPSWTE
jgi:hypothetical protein